MSATPATAATPPSRVGPRQFVDLVKSALPLVKAHDVSSLAAGVAFRIFLAIFPSLAVVVAVVGLVTDDLGALLDGLEFVPEQVVNLIGPELDDIALGSGVALVLGLAASLWAATSAAAALIKALNRIHNVPEARGFVSQRLAALAIIVALILGLATLVGIVVLGPQVRELLLPPDLLGGLGEVAFGIGQGLAALVLLVLLFAFVSWLGPDRERPEWHWITPGSVVGVLGWLVLSTGFTIYAQTFGNYGATYGAIAGVVVVLVWLQLSMLVLLVGACIDVRWESWRGNAASVEPSLGDLDAVVRAASMDTGSVVGGREVIATRSPPQAAAPEQARPVVEPGAEDRDRTRLIAGAAGLAGVVAVAVGRIVVNRRSR